MCTEKIDSWSHGISFLSLDALTACCCPTLERYAEFAILTTHFYFDSAKSDIKTLRCMPKLRQGFKKPMLNAR
ncbi:hypothetical protein SOASR030_09480 [Leminorella grimontii]|uniref:Uncharacterized protein n=1 Tax=Leminorella grimontii TaxID=82981 RepID=A0AAV5MYB9_9GAMM|nr:hypothetical protein SOASR030_09480 [Leminorella grimontii]